MNQKKKEVKTKVEFFRAQDKVLLDNRFAIDGGKPVYKAGYLVTAYTEDKSQLEILAAQAFKYKPTKAKIDLVKIAGECELLKVSAVGGTAEILDMIDEQNRELSK